MYFAAPSPHREVAEGQWIQAIGDYLYNQSEQVEKHSFNYTFLGSEGT